MSSVPGSADSDLWAVLGVFALAAAAIGWSEVRARRRANAVDANGASHAAGPDDDGPPSAHMDGDL